MSSERFVMGREDRLSSRFCDPKRGGFRVRPCMHQELLTVFFKTKNAIRFFIRLIRLNLVTGKSISFCPVLAVFPKAKAVLPYFHQSHRNIQQAPPGRWRNLTPFHIWVYARHFHIGSSWHLPKAHQFQRVQPVLLASDWLIFALRANDDRKQSGFFATDSL